MLVTNVVDQTAEQIGGSSARKTAAEVAALNVTQNAVDDPPVESALDGTDWNKQMTEYEGKCNRLRITYGDVEDLTVNWYGDDWIALSALDAQWIAALDKSPVGQVDLEGCVISG